MRQRRIACVLGAMLSFAFLPSAWAQTTHTSYTVSPPRGTTGTTITVTGTTGCADNPGGPDIEVFLLFGNFSGSTPQVNPGTQLEVNNGAFSGSFVAPDPDDPRYRNNAGQTPGGGTGTGTFAVEARCILANGQRTGQITDNAPTFTYGAPGEPDGGSTTTTTSTTSTTTSTTIRRPPVFNYACFNVRSFRQFFNAWTEQSLRAAEERHRRTGLVSNIEWIREFYARFRAEVNARMDEMEARFCRP